jgi:hypothetical protein
MNRKSDRELKPRAGHILKVGIGCRISGCVDQTELSLDDQEDNSKSQVAERDITQSCGCGCS